jgi:hypothetical protein
MKSCSLGKEHQSRPWSPATNAKINRVQPIGPQVFGGARHLQSCSILSSSLWVVKISAIGFRQMGTVHSEVKYFDFNTALKHMIARFSGFQEFSVNICVYIIYYIACKLKTSYLWYIPTCVCIFPLFSCRPPWFVEVVGKSLCGGPSNWAIATPPKKHTQKKWLWHCIYIHRKSVDSFLFSPFAQASTPAFW